MSNDSVRPTKRPAERHDDDDGHQVGGRGWGDVMYRIEEDVEEADDAAYDAAVGPALASGHT